MKKIAVTLVQIARIQIKNYVMESTEISEILHLTGGKTINVNFLQILVHLSTQRRNFFFNTVVFISSFIINQKFLVNLRVINSTFKVLIKVV